MPEPRGAAPRGARFDHLEAVFGVRGDGAGGATALAWPGEPVLPKRDDFIEYMKSDRQLKASREGSK